MGTLRTYQRTGCDHDMVTLKCPHGTTISVQLAQYGKVSPDQRLCSQGPTTPATVSRNYTCLLPHAVQVKKKLIIIITLIKPLPPPYPKTQQGTLYINLHIIENVHWIFIQKSHLTLRTVILPKCIFCFVGMCVRIRTKRSFCILKT